MVGCTTITVSPDPLKSPPKAGESLVVVSVTSNAVLTAGTLTLRRVSTSSDGYDDTFILNEIGTGSSRDTSLFAGVLTAGKYEFSKFSNGRWDIVFDGKEQSRLNAFTVRPGASVDLGRVIFQAFLSSAVMGRSKIVTSNEPLLARFAPALNKLLSATPDTGWDNPLPSETQIEKYARAHPAGIDVIKDMPDGGVAAASHLGTVFLRSPEGKWAALQSDGLESFIDVTPVDLPDASLLACGELCTLVRQPPGSKELVRVDTGDLPPGIIASGATLPSAGTSLIKMQSTSIFSTPKSLRLATGYRFGMSNSAPEMFSGGMDFRSGSGAPIRVWAMPLTAAISTSSILRQANGRLNDGGEGRGAPLLMYPS